MSAFSPALSIQALISDTIKLLSSFQVELVTTVLVTGVMFFVHKLKSMQFPFDKVSVRFLYENPIGRLFLTEEGATVWNFFSNPYKSKINRQHAIVQYASQIYPLTINFEKRTPEKQDEQMNKDQINEKISFEQLKRNYINTVPLAKLYKNLLLQGYCVSPKFLLQLENFEVREDDVFVISYPRSGTTWTEELVSSIYSQDDLDSIRDKPIHFRVIHLEVGRLFGQEEWLNSLPGPRLLATHLPFSHVPKQLQQLKCKIIYVARNPKDQAVSYREYHKTAKYLGGKRWNWPDFLRLYEQGELVYGGWFEHVLPWYEQSLKNPDKIMFLTYEQLNQNLVDSVKSIASFLQKPLGKQILEKIVENSSFEQMKNNNNVNRMNIPLSSFIDQSSVKFMRKGIIGDWKNFFSKEQSDHFDRMFKERAESRGLRMAFTKEEAQKMYC